MAEFDIVETSATGRYSRFKHVVGSGSYKTVYQAYDLEQGIDVAWNSIPLGGLEDIHKQKILDEVQMLIKLKHSHPRLLSIHRTWMNTHTNTMVFISDLYLAGSLRGFIHRVQRVKVRVIKKWILQMVEGLEYLHSQSIIHRDLKCDNLFFNGNTGDLVIGDFGISRVVSATGMASTVMGTPGFMAPEVYDEKYGVASDIYSFGMCLLELTTGLIPYSECRGVAQVWRKVTSGGKPDALQYATIPSLLDLITRCIHPEPDSRPSWEEIRAHPFLVDGEFDDEIVDYRRIHQMVVAPDTVASKTVLKTVEEEIAEVLNSNPDLQEQNVGELSSPGSTDSTIVIPEEEEPVPPPQSVGTSETETEEEDDTDNEEEADGDS